MTQSAEAPQASVAPAPAPREQGWRRIILALLAFVLLATAWVALNWTAVIGLSEYVSRVAAGSIVAVINAVLAVAMLLWARQTGEAGKS